VPRRTALVAGVLAGGALALLWLSDASVEVHRGTLAAPVVTLRAPAEGLLRLVPVAELVEAGQALASVRGPAPDPSPLRAAMAAVSTLGPELTEVEVASRALASARDAFLARAEAETAARARVAEARLAEAEAALDAAEGRRREAEAALARAATLAGQGIGTEADLARIRVALEIGTQEADAARTRALLLAAERDAARDGLLPADPTARLPEAERAARDLALRSGELAARAAGLRAALAAAEAERARLAARAAAEAPVSAPFAGRILARVEPDGTPVARGAPLFRIADCAAAELVVAVPESLRAMLSPGQPVRVRLSGRGPTREGAVVLPPEDGPVRVRIVPPPGCPLGQAAEVAFGARPFDWLRR
jgi:multidrug resistance efflux pump